MDEPELDFPPPTPVRPPGRAWTIAGFVLAAVALIIAPPIFGAAAVACGVMGLRKGDQLGKKAAIAGVACMVVGIAVGAILYAANEDEALALLLR